MLFFSFDPFSKTTQGSTALHIASEYGSTDIALLLIDRGADLTLTDDSVGIIILKVCTKTRKC